MLLCCGFVLAKLFASGTLCIGWSCIAWLCLARAALSLWWGWAWGLWLGMWGFHSSHQDLENVAVSGAGKQSVVCWAVLWVFACAALQSAEVNALLGVASFFVVFFLLLLINGSINGSRVHNVILK